MIESSIYDQQWTQEIAERVGHTGLGSWLPALGLWVGASRPFPPTTSSRFHIASNQNVSITLHDPAWSIGAPVDCDAWVFYETTLAHSLPLPFGLDPERETEASAIDKLSGDIFTAQRSFAMDVERKVTYFLPDLRAVVIKFQSGGIGIREITITRLFSWPDWRKNDSLK